jgi:hypothetical protein
MSLKNENQLKLFCKLCNKMYASQSSLCNHNKKFHNNKTDTDVVINNTLDNTNANIDNTLDNTIKKYNCSKCNKLFNNYQNRWKHQKVCKFKNNNIIENNTNNNELVELKNTISELKELILQHAKIHPKTLQKINKQLINNNNNSNSNSNNNNTTNNGTVINNTYVKFGSVPHSSVLNESAILNILHKPFGSLEESIKLIHFNKKLPEYNNIYITNMKDTLAYIFDGTQFISVRKNDILDELIDNHRDQIENSFEEFKSKLSDVRIRRLETFLDLINNDGEKYIDGHNRIYKNYKVYKMEDIKMLLYNLSDAKKLEILKTIDINEKIIDDNI